MAKQVVGLFDTMQDAQAAVQDLRDAGFSADNISLVASDARGEYAVGDTDTEAAEGAGAGATGGAILGGLGGLLVGLGALAIPGVGPVVAAGSLATTLGTTLAGAGLGAAAGGLVGALVGAGIPEEDANVYAEGIRRGGALVTVQADSDEDAERAVSILDSHNVIDIDERSQTWRNEGWTRFDESAGPYEGDTRGYARTAGTSREDAPQSEWAESSKVGTAGGAVAGGATGAAIGSAGGPVGTVVGGVAGAAAGAGVGAAGDAAGESIADAATGEDDYGRRSDYATSGTMERDTAAIGSATDYGTTERARADVSATETTGATGFQSGSREFSREEGEMRVPVVEEELRVGKRETEQGGVRVNVDVEEQPVSEDVRLREEQVRVERRPVDQPVDASTVSDAFQEGTFEVRERSEEAVVDKQARVKEEVVIDKDVQERTENIQDTVRRTDVDVEEIEGQRRSSGFTDTSTTRASEVGGTSGSASSTSYDDASRTTGSGEGPIESTLADAKTSAERATGLDLDQSGDVGNRDRRDNF